jgi:preprotein translocase subunit SecB
VGAFDEFRYKGNIGLLPPRVSPSPLRALNAHDSEPASPASHLARTRHERANFRHMTDLPPEGAAGPNGASDAAPGIRILAQFTRDQSFENPHAPDSLRAANPQPQVDVGVELSARGRPDGLFEVDLKLSARAAREAEAVFHAELVYGGLFQLVGVPENDLQGVLMVECPRYLFPFARRIMMEMAGEGGFPWFMLEPIDFAGVYAARRDQVGVAPPIGLA